MKIKKLPLSTTATQSRVQERPPRDVSSRPPRLRSFDEKRGSAVNNEKAAMCGGGRIITIFAVAVLVVGAKATAGRLEVVAHLAAAPTRALEAVLVVEVDVSVERVVARAPRRLVLQVLLFVLQKKN